MRGSPANEVLSRAQAEQRIVATFDKDFGELAFRFGLSAACGVVLFRLTGTNPEEDNARTIAALTSREDWTDKFTVVHEDRIRVRPLSQANRRR